MKITKVSATAVRTPLHHAPYVTEGAGTKNEWGRLTRYFPKRTEPNLEYAIVTIETDEGITGYGEAPVDIVFFGETIEQACSVINDYMGPHFIGRDPFEREALLHLVDYPGNTCAKSALDMALHDLVGRALNTPVYNLLGGISRKDIPVAIEVAGGKPDDMAARCVEMIAKGVTAFKPKIGGLVDQDLDRLKAIREAVGPDVSLRADANQGYSVKEAISLCRKAEDAGIGLELLEQPVARFDLQGLAQVRKSVDTPIEADESCCTLQDAMQVVRHEAADVLNIKPGKCGGLFRARKIAAVAEAAGLKCVIGTAFGLGLERAAKLHLAASSTTIVHAVEFTELDLHSPMLKEPGESLLSFPLKNGCLRVPEGPGLGVELDFEKFPKN
jgi:L-Ala-D/L-Glu epimerase